MALSRHMLNAIHKLAEGGERVASLGYPDIIVPVKDQERILGAKIYSLAYRDDSDSVAKWHGSKCKVPDSHSFFKLMGMTLDVYDVAEHRGGEIIRDLNYPLPTSDLERYDFVLDVGTLEHCFNIAQAAFNMAGLVKQGGMIFHGNPFNCGNHGFYGLNPTWYHDFYKANGFSLMDMLMVSMDGQEVKNIPQVDRFTFVGAEANICIAATRVSVEKMRFPVQSKYARMIKLTPREAVGA